jgi:hypothetical protein
MRLSLLVSLTVLQAFFLLVCCGSPAAPVESSTILFTLSTRSVSGMGESADACLITAVSEEDTLQTGFSLTGDIVTFALQDLPPEQTRIEAGVYAGGSLIAAGESVCIPSQGDTTQAWLRVLYDGIHGEFRIAWLWGAASSPEPPVSILFVGNSHTYWNGGLDSLLMGLVTSAHPEADVTFSRSAFGGVTLEFHWGNSQTMGMINGGGWDLVVLQENTNRIIANPHLMYQYVELIANAVRATGGRPGVFMNWAREHNPETYDQIASVCTYAGALIDGVTIPVGSAFELVKAEAPHIDLFGPDGVHASPTGNYLAVCVIYAALWGESPAGIEYVNDPSITPEVRLLLQEAAWQAVQQYGSTDWRHF